MDADLANEPQGLDARTLIYAAVGAGVGFAAVYLGMPLLGAIEQGAAIRIGTASAAGIFLAFCGALIGRGSAARARLLEGFDPDVSMHEPEAVYDGPLGSGAHVTDEELARVAAEARAVSRRERLATVGSIAAAVGTMSALGALFGAIGFPVSGGVIVGIFILGISAGVLVHKALSPRGDVDDDLSHLDLSTPAAGGLSFDELLASASRLTIARRSGLRSLLGREHSLTADGTALATATEELALWRVLLPAWLVPYRTTLRDGDTALPIEKGFLSPTYRVQGLGATLTETWGGWRLAAGDTTLELKGSLFFGNELAILRGGERVGYLQRRVATGLGDLLTGSELQIEVELPSDATLVERQLLAVAAVVWDRRAR